MFDLVLVVVPEINILFNLLTTKLFAFKGFRFFFLLIGHCHPCPKANMIFPFSLWTTTSIIYPCFGHTYHIFHNPSIISTLSQLLLDIALIDKSPRFDEASCDVFVLIRLRGKASNHRATPDNFSFHIYFYKNKRSNAFVNNNWHRKSLIYYNEINNIMYVYIYLMVTRNKFITKRVSIYAS